MLRIRLFVVFHLAIAAAADPSALFDQARSTLIAGDAPKASALFEKVVSLEPKRADYHDWLARSYMAEAKQTSNAVRLAYLGWNIGTQLEEAVRLDPNLLDARVRLVEYYTMSPRIVGGSASKAKQQARELAKRNAALGEWANGYIAYRAKQYGTARNKFKAAVAAAHDKETKLMALQWLGWLSQETQQYADAFAAFDNMLTIDPGNRDAIFEIERTEGFCRCKRP